MIKNIKYILPNIRSMFYLFFYSLRKYKSKTISGIIFSKDRPIQLDALLRSYYLYCENPCSLTVLYNTSDESFQKGYDELKIIYDSVKFIKENDFRRDLISQLSNIDAEFIFFAVDDMIFIRRFSLSEILSRMSSRVIFSMRLGSRINWCETCQKEMNPIFTIRDTLLEWKWALNEYDWAYRFSVDGNVYKTKEILALTKSFSFKAPNSYEGLMNGFLLFKYKKRGLSFHDPVVTNLVLNKIQSELEYDNLFGEISVTGLLDYWNQGYQFDIEKISEYNFNSVHKITNQIPLVIR